MNLNINMNLKSDFNDYEKIYNSLKLNIKFLFKNFHDKF